MEVAGGARKGIWTEHEDAHGRTFYFNMAVGRSFWELPPELKALVKRPVAGASAAAAATGETGAAAAEGFDEETRRRREQVLQQQQQAAAAANGSGGRATLQERMAAAAQRQKQAELRRAPGDRPSPPQSREEPAAPDASREYLEMVRQLQHSEQHADSGGSKWLVR